MVDNIKDFQKWGHIAGIFLVLFLLFVPKTAIYAQPPDNLAAPSGRVLIVFGPHYGIPTAEVFIPAITADLKAGGIPGENIYVEFLDFFRFPDLAGSRETTALLTRKYAATPIDLVIAIHQEAVDFVARDLGHLFPDVPMLIPGFEAEPAWSGSQRPLISLPTELDIEGTLQLAADLFPAADRLLVITGDDGHSRLFLELISAEAERVSQFREVRHTAGLTYPQMLETVGELSRDTVAIFGTWFADAAGESFTPAAVAAETAARSSVPVFGIRDVHVLSGLVGGSVIVSTRLGQQTAGIALDYLTGELEVNGENITLEARHFPLFDWQALTRYGADPHKLPDTTVFLNRPETLWDTHRPALLTVGTAFLILALLTVLLVNQNRKLKTSVRAQEQTEKQLIVTLDDRETLIGELYHRTNNNMQVIQALLQYRLSAHPELPLAQFVEDVTGQIRSMARAQQELFRAEHLSRIDLAEYLRSVVQLVQDRYPDQRGAVSISLDLQSLSVLLDSAGPLGLVVTELVTNAFRHAFPGPREDAIAGEITVSCAATETGEIEVRVCDNGIEWSPLGGGSAPGAGGLGLAVALVEQQLGGTITLDGHSGTMCVVRFRDDRYEERV